MLLVIGADRGDRIHNLLHGREGEETLLAAIVGSESGLLGDHGTPSRQIAGCTVTEPSRVQPYILVLGAGKLPFGIPDVITIAVPIDA